MHLPQLNNVLTVPVIATLVLSTPGAQALSTAASVIEGAKTLFLRIQRTGLNGMGVVNLYSAVKHYLKDGNAYDPDVENKFTLPINCDGNDKYWTNGGDWNVCYLDGRQFFGHPDIGDFSITYTKAGGVGGEREDGLHHPVLQLKNLSDWKRLDVEDVMAKTEGEHAKSCEKSFTAARHSIVYKCGISKLGTAAFGLSVFQPVDPAPGFTPGWCSMHVVQHQRYQYGIGGVYAFDVVIFDAARKVIGLVQRAPVNKESRMLSVTSHLSWTVDIEAKGEDADPIVFKYGGQTGKSGDESHQSTLGNGPTNGYEYGNRKGDIGFTC